jgi:hypothetical protein
MSPLANFFLSYAPFRLPSHLSSFVRGKTPFSTTPVVVSMLAVYLATIFGIRAMMTDRQPYKLTFLLRMHGMFLSLFSALLLALMLEEVIPQIWKQGLYHALCAVEAWTPVSVAFNPQKGSDSHFLHRDWNSTISSTTTLNTLNSSILSF